MSARERAFAAMTWSLLAASGAGADEGEFLVDLIVVPELAAASHPASGVEAWSPPTSPSSAVFPAARAGVGARYGVGNSLQLGFGGDAAFSAGLVGHDVNVDGFKGDLLTGTYVALAAPVTVGWRFDTGEDISAVVEGSAAPLAVLWSGSALADPKTLDAAGLPSRLPPTIADQWTLGGRVEVRALFEARLFDVFVAAIGPEVTVAWAGAPAVSFGLVLRPSLVVPLPL